MGRESDAGPDCWVDQRILPASGVERPVAADGGWEDDTIETSRQAHHYNRNVELAEVALEMLRDDIAAMVGDSDDALARFGGAIYDAVDHDEIPTQSELQRRIHDETDDFATAVNEAPIRQRELMVEQLDDDHLEELAHALGGD